MVLAKPQVKSKFGKGARGGYPLGFRGDHRVGTSPGRAGRGCSSGAGTGSIEGICSVSDCKIFGYVMLDLSSLHVVHFLCCYLYYQNAKAVLVALGCTDDT